MAVTAGDVAFYKATISGFDGTVTDVDAAGWTRITGTSDLGQSATELAVIDNGLIRVTLDKNQTGEGSLTIYAFNGTNWARTDRSSTAKCEAFEVTGVTQNTAQGVDLALTWATEGPVPGVIGSVSVMRGIPASRWVQTNSVTGSDSFLTLSDSADIQTTLYPEGASYAATDAYGAISTLSDVPTVDNWQTWPHADGLLKFAAFDSDTAISVRRVKGVMGFNYEDIGGSDVPLTFWLGAVPMDYTAPATLDAEIGNTDGQLIEAESYYAWEGETPLIGENLLAKTDGDTVSSGSFETTAAFNAWTQVAGTWTRVTDESKFGTASVECSTPASGALRQNFASPENGATYAMTGWVRTTEHAANPTNCNLQVIKTVGGANVLTTNAVSGSREWTYMSGLFVSDGESLECGVRIIGTSGPVQFDGIQLIKVKNADGTSALAFDTTSTDGWTAGGTNALTTTNAPRGFGLSVVRVDDNTIAQTTIPPQDLSGHRYLSFWGKSTGGNNIAVYTTVAAGEVLLAPTVDLTTEWKLISIDMAAVSSDRSQVSGLRIASGVNDTYFIANFRLSKHDPSIGAKHGILHDMGDAEGLAFWWKGVEEQDVLQEDFQIDGDVLNGNFEAGSGATFTNWVDEGTPTVEEETTTQYAGARSVKVTATGAGFEGIKQSFTATKNTTYSISAYAKVTSGDSAYLRIRDVTDGVNVTSPNTISTSWVKLTSTFSSVAGHTYEVQLLAQSNGDIVWFDEVKVDVNLVANPGFETYTTTPGPPDSWAVGSGTGTDWAKETTIVRSGSNAVKLVQTDTVTAPRITQTLSTTAGKSYYFEAWGRTGGNASDAPQARIFNTTDATTVLEPNSTPGGTTYEKLSGAFYAEAGKNYAVYLGEATGQVGTTVYFDDISVKEIVATDASGEDNHGTLRGATNTAGPTPGAADPFGGTGAVEFDGVDDYIEVADDAALDVTGAITLEAWVNFDAGGAEQRIFDKGGSYNIRLDSSDRVQVFLAGTTTNTTTSSTVLSSSQWYHLVATYDGANVNIYVDGALDKTGANTGSVAATATALNVGRNASSGANLFDGSICGVRIYNRALGADEVAQRYNTRTHEAVAGWVVETEAVERLRLSSDSKESAKSLSYTAPDSAGPRYTYSSPQDWSSYKYLSGWFKSDNGADATLVVTEEDGTAHTGSAVANGVQVIGQVPGAWMHGAFDLDQFSTLDKTQIRTIGFVNVNAIGVTNHYLDGLKLTSLEEVGDWRYSTSDGASGYTLNIGDATVNPVPGDSATIPFIAPAAGEYYIGVMIRDNAATTVPSTLDLRVDGGALLGTPKSLSNNTFLAQENQVLFGPVSLTEGAHTVALEYVTTGDVSIGQFDFIAIYPYQADGSTPAGDTILFPKNLSNALLRKVTYE